MGEGSSGSKKCQESHEHSGMHHVLAKVVFKRQKTKEYEEESENTRNESGFMGRASEDESPDS